MLKASTKQATVPYVFVGGELLGGCDATKAAQADGSLFTRLHKQGIHAKVRARMHPQICPRDNARCGGALDDQSRARPGWAHVQAGAGGAFKVGDAVLQGRRRALSTLFSFPEVVDDRAARFNGVWVRRLVCRLAGAKQGARDPVTHCAVWCGVVAQGFIICLLVAVFYKKVQAHWVMCGLMVDFALRFVGGEDEEKQQMLARVVVFQRWLLAM